MSQKPLLSLAALRRSAIILCPVAAGLLFEKVRLLSLCIVGW